MLYPKLAIFSVFVVPCTVRHDRTWAQIPCQPGQIYILYLIGLSSQTGMMGITSDWWLSPQIGSGARALCGLWGLKE